MSDSDSKQLAGVRKQSGASGGSRRNLVGEVSAKLREALLEGTYEPGDKLPTEAELTREYRVSRTVVREAIASLRADGLAEARHGVGVFVLAPERDAPAIRPVDRARISSMIELLELRAAVEIEAAGIAAERRSPAQEEILFERFDDLERLITKDQSTVDADLAFHLAIAEATNNPRFGEFLKLMGESLIPRSALPDNLPNMVPAGYGELIQAEHRAIIQAVSEGDITGARDAMRAHLKGSRHRYRRLIRGD